jgi:hypothetical protein
MLEELSRGLVGLRLLRGDNVIEWEADAFDHGGDQVVIGIRQDG